MNENIRILLLALGIVAVVASDPPVAHWFEQPRSACGLVTDLAVGAFESLVLSTLPPSEPGEEVFAPERVARTEGERREASAAEDSRLRQSFVMTGARRVMVESCQRHKAPVEMLRVEARIEVQGSPVEKG